MKKVVLVSAAILVAASGAAFANHHMHGEGRGLRIIDTNKDGMISKDEFMKHHETMWDSMKKNSAGTVDMKDFEAMRQDMGARHMHMQMMKEEKK